jgi:hypothetical protein
MKTDTYTKIVLTIIAICLVVIVVEDIPIVEEANAQSAGGGVVSVDLVSIAGQPFHADGGLGLSSVSVPVVVKR